MDRWRFGIGLIFIFGLVACEGAKQYVDPNETSDGGVSAEQDVEQTPEPMTDACGVPVSVASCGDVRPDCPVGTFATVRHDCHACVDAQTCDSMLWDCSSAWRDAQGTCRGLSGAVHPRSCCEGEPLLQGNAIQGEGKILLYFGDLSTCSSLAASSTFSTFTIALAGEGLEPQRIYDAPFDKPALNRNMLPEENGISAGRCDIELHCNGATEGTIWIGEIVPGEYIEGGLDVWVPKGVNVGPDAYQGAFKLLFCE